MSSKPVHCIPSRRGNLCQTFLGLSQDVNRTNEFVLEVVATGNIGLVSPTRSTVITLLTVLTHKRTRVLDVPVRVSSVLD